MYYNHYTLSRNLTSTVALLATLLVMAFHGTASSQIFSHLDPRHATHGDTVTLHGEGFDTQIDYTIDVGVIPATVTDIQANFIEFIVPAGAVSGLVTVGTEDFDLTHSDELTITREISADIDVSISLDGYFFGTVYGDKLWEGSATTISIATGKPTIVCASGKDGDPSLFAYVTDTTTDITITPETTAAGMLFMSSIAFSADPDEADNILDFLAVLEETCDLADIVDNAVAAGIDYTDDPQFENLVISALQQFLESDVFPMPEQSANTMQLNATETTSVENYANRIRDFATDYPRDIEIEGVPGLNRLIVSAEPVLNNDRGVPELGIKYTSATSEMLGGFRLVANPLDWIACVYELDPMGKYFSAFKASADALGNSSGEKLFARIQSDEIHRVVVPAEPLFKDLHVINRIRNLVFKEEMAALEDGPPISRIPADRSGLYMVRVFSGAQWDFQNSLIDDLPNGEREELLMIHVNIVLAIIESLDAVADIFNFFPGPSASGVMFNIEGHVLSCLVREHAQGTLNGHVCAVIYQEAMKEYHRQVRKEQTGFVVNALLGPLAVLTKIAVVTTKVGNVATRILALSNAANYIAPDGIETVMAQSVETTIAIVGDPWRPEITSFFPQSGHRGTLVHINGRRFSTTLLENEVDFNSTPVSGTDPNPPVPHPAEVISATETLLTVRVPEGVDNGTGFITVRCNNRGRSMTTDLDPPFQTFYVIPDPVITAIEPVNPLVSNMMKVKGQHFAPRHNDNMIRYGSDTLHTPDRNPTVVTADQTMMIVKCSYSLTPDTVRVEVNGRPSNVFEFTPNPGYGESGSSITVTSLADNINSSDPEVTLREAIMFAAGTLTPNMRPEDDTSDDPYESDHISSCPDYRPPPYSFCRLGPGYGNTISIDYSLAGGEILLTGPLPEIASNDTIAFASVYPNFVTINGNGMAGDCFRISGKENIRISDLKITNFGGSGIHLLDGSKGTVIYNIAITSCNIGVNLDGNAVQNTFDLMKIDRCSSHGVLLSGPDVVLNTFSTYHNDNSTCPNDLYSRNNGGYGVLIDKGASFNSVCLGEVSHNTSGGYKVTGTSTISNHIGISSDIKAWVLGDIFGNGGPGVTVDTGPTTIRRLRISGNEGDGILLTGTDCRGIDISVCRIGYGDQGAESANNGSGIHIINGASNINIGAAGSITTYEIPINFTGLCT